MKGSEYWWKALINGAIQKVVPTSLPTRILNLPHYSLLTGHPDARRIYDPLKREFYWPFIVRKLCKVVYSCTELSQMGSTFSDQGKLELFPFVGSFQFLSIESLKPLSRTKRGNQLVVIMTEMYSELTRRIPITEKTSTLVVSIFFNDLIISYGLPKTGLSDNGQ